MENSDKLMWFWSLFFFINTIAMVQPMLVIKRNLADDAGPYFTVLVPCALISLAACVLCGMWAKTKNEGALKGLSIISILGCVLSLIWLVMTGWAMDQWFPIISAFIALIAAVCFFFSVRYVQKQSGGGGILPQ